ncbi:50S ribosomal protein L23 [Candidatus Dojkabacteria bacterium]|nr:50S ribosomal protein L23 [Candidatus Dojkabacteria bacterium]
MKNLVIQPIITEKSLNLVETENQYTFMVGEKTNKFQIKKEIENRFGVTVLSVKTMIYLGKRTAFGRKRIPGIRPDFKKAIVTIKKGDTIPDFDIK